MKTFKIIPIDINATIGVIIVEATHYSIDNRIGVFMNKTVIVHSVPADKVIVELVDAG